MTVEISLPLPVTCGLQARSDAIGSLISIMVLTAFAGATMGLFIGTTVKLEQMGLMFALIFTP